MMPMMCVLGAGLLHDVHMVISCQTSRLIRAPGILSKESPFELLNSSLHQECARKRVAMRKAKCSYAVV